MTDQIETYRGRNGWRYRYAGRDDGDYMTEAMARQAAAGYAQRRPSDREMLDECEDLVRADGGPKFTEWEHDFLISMNAQLLDGKPFSEAQRAKLDQLWRKR